MLIYILIIAIIILLFLVIYIICRQRSLYEQKRTGRSVLILKTHIWNDSLEKFAIKLNKETKNLVDFFILMHSNDYNLQNKIKDPLLKQHIMIFSEDDIKNVYDKGFYSMWLSNHWILMWFYKKLKTQYGDFPYDYVWSTEYDVRISGDSSKIWSYPGNEDFLYPIDPFKDPNWSFKNHYVGGKLKDNDKYYGYLQLARYSRRFLEYLNDCYEAGENGQDELITFSLFKRGKFKGSKKLLNGLIKNSWSVDNTHSKKHTTMYNSSENDHQLRIFHPIKGK